MEFRYLRPEEVECRIGVFKEGKGVSLLLYKTARVDMDILDETVGAMNWQKSYSRDNANCTVSIWDAEKKQWISKEDTGTESRTEAEKGLASDSFKRACFNWGIGRELYSAPFIWIPGAGKYDRFWVKEMEVENKKITRLVIGSCDQYGNRVDKDEAIAFTYPRDAQKRRRTAKKDEADKDTAEQVKTQENAPTDEDKAKNAYPPREKMIDAIVMSGREDILLKALAGWKLNSVEDVPDAGIMALYNHFLQKGLIDAKADN